MMGVRFSQGGPLKNFMLIDNLKTLLASSFGFSIKTANFHWNCEGADFTQYHPWLGDLYSEVLDTTDQLAEYIRALQAYTPASFIRFQELSEIKDQIDLVNFKQAFQILESDNQKMIDLFLQAFDVAAKENQQGIANFLAERIDFHQKYAWQIRSILKA